MTKTNEEVSFKGEMTHAEFLKAWEAQSAGWKAAWEANNEAFELTMKQKDRGEFDVTSEMAGFWGDEDVLEDDSLWIVENRDDSMADNVDAFFATEDDSVNDALLFCDAVEELNERG